MADPIENRRLERLSLAKYRFRMAAETPIRLPPFKGSTLHGGFGHALKTISSFYYRALFDPGAGNGYPKPFVLLPPLDSDRSYAPGRKFAVELTLLGTAVEHFAVCHAAMEYLGATLGFGINRGKYRIIGVEAARPGTAAAQKGANGSLPAAVDGRSLAEMTPGPGTGKITLKAVTRLRLKDRDHLVGHTPPFDLFFARLLGRLNTLSVAYGRGTIIDSASKRTLLEKAGRIALLTNGMTWHDWHRFSGRQNTRMKFGGLLGTVTYTGDLTPFMPYLAIGQWTHTGGKTSFGLGKFTMETTP